MEELLKSLNSLFRTFELTDSEIRIYTLLLKDSLTPRQISKRLGISERIVRERLKHLLNLGLVERNLVDRGWIGYVYRARPLREAIEGIIKRLEEVEKEVEGLL
ncbi:helix-turn-helix domain-containing protein [Palaeococcus ferrophilus]|uniref:helix-turn-helix domain-containing protein n=1 Tax=Palaeococcus ferrophilus TaxID=83868 RepID=UPI00064ED5F9|nr:helix-turn-helix domain-containing protein [Palaeococcus ferrophilus]